MDCSGALEGGPPPGRAASSAGSPHELAFGPRTAHLPGLGSSPKEEIPGRGQARGRAGVPSPGPSAGVSPVPVQGCPCGPVPAATRTGARAVRSQQPPRTAAPTAPGAGGLRPSGKSRDQSRVFKLCSRTTCLCPSGSPQPLGSKSAAPRPPFRLKFGWLSEHLYPRPIPHPGQGRSVSLRFETLRWY